jgi:hypothetical protein
VEVVVEEVLVRQGTEGPEEIRTEKPSLLESAQPQRVGQQGRQAVAAVVPAVLLRSGEPPEPRWFSPT